MRLPGLEPGFLSEADFKSAVYAYSTIIPMDPAGFEPTQFPL